MKRYVIEFVGTFFVVFAISLTEYPIAIGFMYLAMLYIGARISGAHYNPAVTQALWLRGEFQTARIPAYVIAQLLGAIVAISLELYASDSLFVPQVSSEDSIWLIGLLEVLLTFVLCYVYLVTRTVHIILHTELYGLILGLTLVGLASMGGLVNPAIGVASLLVNAVLYSVNEEFATLVPHLGYNVLVYVVCPLIGSALAGLAFDYLEAPVRGVFPSVNHEE